MKMVRADVHLILLKATHLLWLVSSDFAFLILTFKSVLSFPLSPSSLSKWWLASIFFVCIVYLYIC